MSVIIILLLISICIAGGFLLAFLWSVKDGQLDDTESPPQRILFDEFKKQNNK
jgi:cbb3-type cytochrome oxidase maturation protein